MKTNCSVSFVFAISSNFRHELVCSISLLQLDGFSAGAECINTYSIKLQLLFINYK